MAKDWIAKAIGKPGALHAQLHVPAKEKIPAGLLAKAAKKGGKLGARARLAETLKGFHHPHKFVDDAVDKHYKTMKRRVT